MKKLDELRTRARATVVRFDGDAALRKRLYAFGIEPECEIQLKQKSLGNRTIEIRCNKSLIALRQDEANRITVRELP